MADKKAVKKAAESVVAEFLTAHGKTARAVVEPIGRAGARIVLVGEDGAMGDLVLPSVEAATEVVSSVRGLEAAEWDRETTAQLKIGSAHRKKMARMQR